MQAVAAEFSGCAGKFYSLLKRRVTRLLTLFNGGPPVLRAPILVLKFTRSLNLNNKGTRNVAIENKRLGKRGVLVSNICLGTMNFGWHTTQEESFKMMDRALELGINFFDTADVYGWGGERATPRRSWDAGLPREVAAGTLWSWLPKSSIPSNARPTCPNPTRTVAAFRRTRSASTAKAA